MNTQLIIPSNKSRQKRICHALPFNIAVKNLNKDPKRNESMHINQLSKCVRKMCFNKKQARETYNVTIETQLGM
jgi:hypothetical protein